ncbi:MAG: 6-carboxytetrahydropterin synthase QueD [Planctomycetota bacterium]|nr:6-carboxytetrahydropterin synthase QueD [Planctomycetota bacterium]
MYFVTQEMDFCYGHRLLNYDGKCRNLHGHNGKLEVLLGGETLDHRGMLIDFTDIKLLLRTWIEENLDHRMLLHESDPLLPLLQAHDQPVFVMDSNPTAENIARVIYERALHLGLPIREVRLWETPKASSIYRRA